MTSPPICVCGTPLRHLAGAPVLPPGRRGANEPSTINTSPTSPLATIITTATHCNSYTISAEREG